LVITHSQRFTAGSLLVRPAAREAVAAVLERILCWFCPLPPPFGRRPRPPCCNDGDVFADWKEYARPLLRGTTAAPFACRNGIEEVEEEEGRGRGMARVVGVVVGAITPPCCRRAPLYRYSMPEVAAAAVGVAAGAGTPTGRIIEEEEVEEGGVGNIFHDLMFFRYCCCCCCF